MPPSSAPGSSTGTTPSKPRRHRPEWLERTEIWLVLIVLGITVLAGGGTPVWARAIVLIVTGAWIIWQPPKETPSRLFEIAVLVLIVVCAASTFLPVTWLGRVAWRDDLARMGIALPATNAPAPWLAGEAVAQLLAGLAWFYACWNLRLSHEARKRALWGLAVLVAALAAGAACGNLLHEKYPLGAEAMNFSYFPNRNQSALWYCVGGVIAFGLMVDGMHRRRGRVFVAAGMLVACMLALVMGDSRMALALFCLGVVAAVVVRLGRNSGKYLLRVVAPLGIAGFTLLVIFSDRNLLNRLPLVGDGSNAPEFRLALWHDTLDLAKAQPFGAGLGQFSLVYPQYRYYALSYQTVLHPDSDWMWLLGEAGWAGLAAGALAAGALVAAFCGKRWSACGPYRHLAALCAGLFFLHSFVDVPAHRWGTWMLAAFLVGIAAPDGEGIQPVATWVPRWVWRMAGLASFFLGGAWMAAQAGLLTNSTLVEQRAEAKADRAISNSDAETALVAANEAAKIEPLLWRPYFLRARIELNLQNNPAAALRDFRIARFLEPTWARVPYYEGLLWEPTNHDRAFAAWREAIHRQDATPEGLWRNIYDQLKTWPDGQDYASILSQARPLFRLEYLVKQVPAARLSAEWKIELQRDPDLREYTEPQRHDLLERVASVDGPAALNFLRAHPEAIRDAWMVEAAADVSAGDARDALSLARQHLKPIPLPDLKYSGPTDLLSVKMDFAEHPDDLSAGTELARMQFDAKDYAGEAQTLGQMAKWHNPPPFVAWCLSDALARAGKLDEAWAALKPYLQYEKNLSAQKQP